MDSQSNILKLLRIQPLRLILYLFVMVVVIVMSTSSSPSYAMQPPMGIYQPSLGTPTLNDDTKLLSEKIHFSISDDFKQADVKVNYKIQVDHIPSSDSVSHVTPIKLPELEKWQNLKIRINDTLVKDLNEYDWSASDSENQFKTRIYDIQLTANTKPNSSGGSRVLYLYYVYQFNTDLVSVPYSLDITVDFKGRQEWFSANIDEFTTSTADPLNKNSATHYYWHFDQLPNFQSGFTLDLIYMPEPNIFAQFMLDINEMMTLAFFTIFAMCLHILAFWLDKRKNQKYLLTLVLGSFLVPLVVISFWLWFHGGFTDWLLGEYAGWSGFGVMLYYLYPFIVLGYLPIMWLLYNVLFVRK